MHTKKRLIEIKAKLSSIKKNDAHIIALKHLSSFSSFFLNVASIGDEIEESFGIRAEPHIIPPLSFTILNTILYHYTNKDSPYYKQLRESKIPIHKLQNHSILKFNFPSISKKIKKNTIETISLNTKIPKETTRRTIKKWMDAGLIIKDKNLGLVMNFEVAFDTKLFKKYNLFVTKRMGANWVELVNILIKLKYLDESHRFKLLDLNNISNAHYQQLVTMLHWYYLLCFSYMHEAKLTYNEFCIISSALYFNPNSNLESLKSTVDYYKTGVLRPVNITSISQSTGISRETVRRIVEKLIQTNSLTRNHNKIYVNEIWLDPKSITTKLYNLNLSILDDILLVFQYTFSRPNEL